MALIQFECKLSSEMFYACCEHTICFIVQRSESKSISFALILVNFLLMPSHHCYCLTISSDAKEGNDDCIEGASEKLWVFFGLKVSLVGLWAFGSKALCSRHGFKLDYFRF